MEYTQHFTKLNPGSRDHYDPVTALSLAVACELAYEEPSIIELAVKEWGFEFGEYINVVKGNDIDTQCYVMHSDTDIVVAFCGSESLKDWLTNFQTVYDPGPLTDTRAHEGFQDALFPAVLPLIRYLETCDLQNKRLWITGHSLGGALCSLFAGMLCENNINVYSVYTFASPRPADSQFEKQLNDAIQGPHIRVVNFGDLVPHVPPEPFYSHPGYRVILRNDFVERTSKSWFKQRINAIKAFIGNTADIFNVGDNHRLNAGQDSYIPRLIKACQRGE